MRYKIAIWSICALLASASTSAPVRAAATQIRGTRVTIENPPGFKPAIIFSGLTNNEQSASVMITEMPIPFLAATSAYNEAGLQSKGMKLVSKETVHNGGYDGYLIEARQIAQGTEFAKWINVFGDKSMTILVTATFPTTQSESLSKPLKDAVLSAHFDGEGQGSDPMKEMPFTVSGTSSLKIAGRVQSSLVFTPSGSMSPASDSSAPSSSFVIGQSLSALGIDDKSAFAKGLLEKNSQFSDPKILSEKEVTIAGLPARELTASARNKKGEETFILQTIVFGKSSYLVLQGVTDMSRRTRMEYEFRSIINSLKLKTPDAI